MTRDELSDLYHGHLDCLNRRSWPDLGRFVHAEARHNGEPLGLSGYRATMERDVAAIADLRFDVQVLACNPPWISSRLAFDCTPVGRLFGLPVNGRRVRFAENVVYEVRDGRIAEVWSLVDRAAIEAQLALGA